MKKLTVHAFFKKFPDDDACLAYLFEVRFGQGTACPKCEREAKWYKIKQQRAYSCQWCGHHIHPTVGTLFEGSRTSLQLWFYAIWLFTTTRHGVSGKELERQLGVTYKCAYRMGQKIREHMAKVDGDSGLSGHVEADETYVGGKPRYKGSRRGGRSAHGKTIVFGMVQRGGDVMAQVIPNASRKTIEPIIYKNVAPNSVMSTDEWVAYDRLVPMGYIQGRVNHGTGEYVRGIHHTNSIEGFWSLLKKAIRSTHIHVSKKHLAKYVKEFEYRYNLRSNPERMFPELISSFSP